MRPSKSAHTAMSLWKLSTCTMIACRFLMLKRIGIARSLTVSRILFVLWFETTTFSSQNCAPPPSSIAFSSKQWERSSTPLHIFQRVTNGGVEEVMESKRYGITVRRQILLSWCLISFSANLTLKPHFFPQFFGHNKIRVRMTTSRNDTTNARFKLTFRKTSTKR
jgi:hypothetical protein